jgi:HlyD family secretion protein
MGSFRNWLIGGVVVVAALAAYFYYQSVNNANASEFQTTPVVRGNLIASVGATGTVRSQQLAILTWQTTGTVGTVLVNVGDTVKKDDKLATIEPTTLAQNIILAEVDLLNAERTLSDLRTSTTARSQAELAVLQAQKALEEAEKKVIATGYARASDTYIDNVKADLDLLNDRLAIARSAYDAVRNLPDGDAHKTTALANMTGLELQRNQKLAEYNFITGTYKDSEIAERQRNFEIAQAQLADAERRLERLKDGTDPLEVARLQAQITAAQATLNLASIRAPFDGVITLAEPAPGDQITPGTLAFRVDDLDKLLVDVQISEVDINAIKVGQPVMLAFDAILGKDYSGVVTEVGQVGTTVAGAVTFTVTLELLDADDQVRPGMTAAVTITIREVNDVLLVPNRAVRLVNGERVVYVLRDGAPVMVGMRLGATSDTVSEAISDGLSEGDSVILNPPTSGFGFGPPPGVGGR